MGWWDISALEDSHVAKADLNRLGPELVNMQVIWKVSLTLLALQQIVVALHVSPLPVEVLVSQSVCVCIHQTYSWSCKSCICLGCQCCSNMVKHRCRIGLSERQW